MQCGGKGRNRRRKSRPRRSVITNGGYRGKGYLGGNMTLSSRHDPTRTRSRSRVASVRTASSHSSSAMSTLAPPASATASTAATSTPPTQPPSHTVPDVVTVTSTSLAPTSTNTSPPSREPSDAKGKDTTTKPVLELLPPSPTRLSFSDPESSIEESDVDAPRPSPISELVRICAGGGAVDRAESVRSARIEVETEDGTIVRPSSRFLGIGLSSPFGSPSSPSSTRSAGSSSGGLLGFGKGGGVWNSGSSTGSGTGGRLLRLALPWKRKDVTEPIRVTTSPTPSAREAPFAKELEVKGWQIVGGRNFDDKARVGAYVGALRDPWEELSYVWFVELMTVYDIELQLRNGSTVNILRRYTEFVRLRKELQAAYPVSRSGCAAAIS